MKVYFLGTGTSTGVPLIGCDCSVCQSVDRKNRRFRTHAHVEVGGLNIQIDAAPEFRIQALKHDIRRVDFVILTHGHADHILGMDDLRRYCAMRDGEALTVYTNEEGETRMRSMYPYAILDRARVHGYPAFKVERMPATLDLGSVRIHSVNQSHGSFETLGLVFEEVESNKRFAYFTDCDSVSEEAARIAAGVDLAALDGLREKPHASHMSIDQAVEAAKRIQAKRTFLVHMTHDVDHATTEAGLPDGVNLAYDDLVVEV